MTSNKKYQNTTVNFLLNFGFLILAFYVALKQQPLNYVFYVIFLTDIIWVFLASDSDWHKIIMSAITIVFCVFNFHYKVLMHNFTITHLQWGNYYYLTKYNYRVIPLLFLRLIIDLKK